MRNPVY